MINGIELFQKHFREYAEQYTIIGGFACDLLMEDAGLEFRQTADIDMVLILEALTTEFAEAFWEFIEKGGYHARQRSSGQPEFYRFVEPEAPSYPKMIELFSRPGSSVTLQPGTYLAPLHISDEVSSLSAILLNEDYYQFLLDGRIEINGISVLDAEHIIPLKMRAWLDLKSKKEQGIHVNSRDLRKHRLDVFRLFRLVRERKVPVPAAVLKDIQDFILQMRETDMRLTDIGITRPKEEILDLYTRIYIEKTML